MSSLELVLPILTLPLLALRATSPGLGWEACYTTSSCASVSPLESRLIIPGPPCFWVVVKLASGGRSVYLTHLGVLGSFWKPRKELWSPERPGPRPQDGVITEMRPAELGRLPWPGSSRLCKGSVVWDLSLSDFPRLHW